MLFRTNGNAGCLIGILFMVVAFYVIRLTGAVVFGTPVGLVLIAYIIYRYFKKNKQAEVSNTYEAHEPDFDKSESVIDVEFEEVDSDK
jgi:hypothetical protein